MATIDKPEMPILRETPDQIYQRMVNRMYVLAERRGMTPPAVEEGEIFYDLLYPLAEEISEQQQLLEYAFLQAFLPWADGDYLDAHGYLLGLDRKPNEEHEQYRSRLIERARTEEGNGRPSDYEMWAKNIAGVGSATAVEKERSDTSVDVYITNMNGQPATPEFCDFVRTQLEEWRVALHDLKVYPAPIFIVKVNVKISLQPGVVIDTVKQEMEKRMREYLKGRTQIVYQQLGAFFFVPGVADYSNYLLNSGTVNVVKPLNAVSILELVVTT
ncbi:baseplate J/gp47 family protein [Brevibacillus choshinensis]|uniref:baseplate J/gp47 family protein n=1 Tax=Brevibacillus choshinensis TaxID=54911 RepID=UPI002E247FEB|nr:baseplate J/gp47 family protein [Brevibacillus choshinensis]